MALQAMTGSPSSGDGCLLRIVRPSVATLWFFAQRLQDDVIESPRSRFQSANFCGSAVPLPAAVLDLAVSD